MLTIEIQPKTLEVFVYYNSQEKRFFDKIKPGGRFLGLTYNKLLKLGNGVHEVLLEESDPGYQGSSPFISDQWEWSRFCYEYGEITSGERRWMEQMASPCITVPQEFLGK